MTGDGPLTVRLGDMARRCGDLSPVAQPIRALFVQDNTDAVLAGQDCRGRTVAPLAASTLDRRSGTGPARAPHGAASRIVAGLVVAVFAGVARLTYTKSWPGFERAARAMATGTRHMPARDPSGVRPEALARAADLVKTHIIRGR